MDVSTFKPSSKGASKPCKEIDYSALIDGI
jgi:hypothetical protein